MITITGLCKSYGRLKVLNGIELELRKGHTTALVGPNAAGKTTLIKTILGLARPDSGVIRFDGDIVAADPRYRARIGYMPQISRFPEHLRARELIGMLVDLRQVEAPSFVELVETFGLQRELDKPLGNLSGGTRQKVNAVVAFLFTPPMLILDEPTASLDPVSSGILKARIQKAQRQGGTILFASHIMTEVDELAEDVIFLMEGRVQFAGAVRELKAKTRQVNLEKAIATLMLSGVAA